MSTIHKTSTFVTQMGKAEFKITQPVSIGLMTRFGHWCESIAPYRYVILSAMILFQGSIVVPAALLTIFHLDAGITGLSVFLMAISTFMMLVANLAVAPMKWVMGSFFLNLIIVLTLMGIHIGAAIV